MQKSADRGHERGTALSVLMVEDSADDAQLNALALEHAGYELRWKRVEDAEAMVAALERDDWDIALCDHQMPRLDSLRAVDLLREIGSDIPCVVVSGAVGEEAAASAVRAGAADFLSKGNIERLGAVVDRCMREAGAHRAQKTAEAAMVASEARLRAALEAMPDAFALLRAVRDGAGDIVDFAPDYVNAALCELTGLSRDKLEAGTVLEFQEAGHLLAFDPAHLRAGLLAAFCAVVETGAPLLQENVVFPNRAAGEGDEITLEISAKKVADGCVVIARDISGRSRADAERARLAAIVRSSDDAIFSVDADLRITSWNSGAEALYGYPSEEVLGKSSELVIPSDATLESSTLRERVLAGETVHRYETQRLRKDGTLIDVTITSFPLFDAASNSHGAASVACDITERKQAERALAESEQRYREILDTTPDGVLRLDVGHHIDYVNQRMAEILGYSPEEVLGWHVGELIDPEERETSERNLDHDRAYMTGRVVERRLKRKDHRPCWARISTTALSDGESNYNGALAIVSDITASKAQAAELRTSEHFLTAVADGMAEGMLAMDQDGRVTYMNRAAEHLLGWSTDEIGTRSMHDTIHYQHEDGSAHPAADCPLLGALRTGTPVRVEEDVFTRRDGRLLPVAYSSSPITIDDDMQGLVVVFRDISARRAEEQRHKQELETLNWVGRIRDALDDERFVLYAQPIIDLHNRDVVAHELLLRIVDRDGAIIAPGRFLPAAEQFGLIEEIDRWVLAEAVKLAARGLKVHFNISGRSLGAHALISDLDRALHDTGAAPALLVCEITETALAKNEAVAAAFVHELAAFGCGIALDDFGTGYGGFGYLKRLPVSALKIDMEFVRDLIENSENQHIVKAIVTLAKGFGRNTIAEGVEDEATLELLEAYGVDYAQGFVIGRPAPLDPHTQLPGATRRQATTLSGA